MGDMFAWLASRWNHPQIKRRRVYRVAILLPFLAAGFVLIDCAFDERPIAFSIVNLIPILTFTFGMQIGFALIAIGKPTREGIEKYCGCCEYQVAPTGERSERCPECGADWRSGYALVTGKRVVHKGFIWAGVAVLAVSLVPIITEIALRDARRKWPYALTSSEALIHYIASNCSYVDRDTFAVVFGRTLTEMQQQRLATALLDRREREGYIFLPASPDWLCRYVASGRAPDEIVRRYFEETFVCWLSSDQPVAQLRSWAAFSVKTQEFYSGNCISLFPDRFYLDGMEVLAERAAVLRDLQNSKKSFTFVPPTPGKHRLTLTALAIAHAPPAWAPGVARDGKGEPIIPAWAIAWRRLKFEAEVVAIPLPADSP